MKIGVYTNTFTGYLVSNKFFTPKAIYNEVKHCKYTGETLSALLKLMGNVELTNDSTDFNHQLIVDGKTVELRTSNKTYKPEPEHKVVKFKYIGGSSPEYCVSVEKESDKYLEGTDVVEKQYKKFAKKNIRNMSVVL